MSAVPLASDVDAVCLTCFVTDHSTSKSKRRFVNNQNTCSLTSSEYNLLKHSRLQRPTEREREREREISMHVSEENIRSPTPLSNTLRLKPEQVIKYSFLTPRLPNKTLGGPFGPGTLTHPQAQEREIEREAKVVVSHTPSKAPGNWGALMAEGPDLHLLPEGRIRKSVRFSIQDSSATRKHSYTVADGCVFSMLRVAVSKSQISALALKKLGPKGADESGAHQRGRQPPERSESVPKVQRLAV